ISVAAGPQNQVPVVRHHEVAENPHRPARDRLAQRLLKGKEVVVLFEDGSAGVRTIENMKPSCRELFEQCEAYPTLYNKPADVSLLALSPFSSRSSRRIQARGWNPWAFLILSRRGVQLRDGRSDFFWISQLVMT
ncbi:hypothetical protein LCGC14_3152150, partial [marine sediment metagenome]